MGPTLSDCDSRRTMLATVTHSPVGINNLNTPHEIEAAFSTVSSTASPRCPCGLPQQERNARTRVAEEKTSQIPKYIAPLISPTYAKEHDLLGLYLTCVLHSSNSHTPVVTASLHLQCKWEGCRYSGSFNGKASLVRHLQTEHMDLDTAPLRFQCKWKDCRYLGFFKRKGSLVRHLQTLHIDPLSHSCRVQHCDKAFNRKDNLVQHMLAHRQPY